MNGTVHKKVYQINFWKLNSKKQLPNFLAAVIETGG